jgi:ABC-type nitrate/sulfonate/bicarbonate transport system permease component
MRPGAIHDPGAGAAQPVGLPAAGLPVPATNLRPGRRLSWRAWILPSLVVAAMLAAWEAAVHLFGIPHYILPAPSEIVTVLAQRWDVFAKHTGITVAESVAGAALGIGLGVALAMAMFLRSWLEQALYPLLIASQNVPVFAVAPLLVVWFGYGFGSKVAMAAITVFFPMTVAALDGLKRTDPDWVRLFRTMGATRRQVFWRLRLPAALPSVFSGLKLAAVYASVGAVLGEWAGAGAGLGYLMLSANAQLRVAEVFAAIVCLTPIGLVLLGLVVLLERRLTPWQRVTRDAP